MLRAQRRSRIISIKRKIVYSLVSIAAIALLAAYAAFFSLVSGLPSIPEDLRQLVYAQPTEVYADDGTLLYRLGGQSYVSLDKISPYFQQAVVAAEDKHFWQHHGLDKLALMRAVYKTVFQGKTQGGSTITQQLVKNMYFSFQKLFLRKIKEMLVALQIETLFSKAQILEAYCNLIYFGGTAYGVEDASQQFFAKPASVLTLPEAALLAGIINSPQALNPYSHFDAAKRRQILVLRRMLEDGMIDSTAFEDAANDSLQFRQRRIRSNDFIDYTLSLAEERYGNEAVYFGGLKIFTSLDIDLQHMAEQELAIGLRRLGAELDSTGMPLQGAMTIISVRTGEVKALVGGRKHLPGGFNRAVSSNRHVGSGIKPFLYYAAFEKLGYTPMSVVMDTLSTFRDANGRIWRPRNFDRQYRGQLIVKAAFMQSINVIAAQFGYQLTPAVIKETLRRFGVTSDIPEVLSVSLGTVGISPVEMAAGYAVFARNGIYYQPVFIKRVEDQNGIILDRAFHFGDRRLDARLSFEVLDMMQGVVQQGTGRSVRRAGFTEPCAGKTGTSTEYTDAWFNGITTSLAASVWVGYDKKYRLYRKNGAGVTGGYAAAPIWANFMKRAVQRYPAREFKPPPGLKRLTVDPVHGWYVAEAADGIPVVVPEEAIPSLPVPLMPRQWEMRMDTLAVPEQ